MAFNRIAKHQLAQVLGLNRAYVTQVLNGDRPAAADFEVRARKAIEKILERRVAQQAAARQLLPGRAA